eukprot:scaffold3403_cov300-Pinguiococcus_pyrenoidosus.AAC.8
MAQPKRPKVYWMPNAAPASRESSTASVPNTVFPTVPRCMSRWVSRPSWRKQDARAAISDTTRKIFGRTPRSSSFNDCRSSGGSSRFRRATSSS